MLEEDHVAYREKQTGQD